MFQRLYTAAFGVWAAAGDAMGDLAPMMDRIGFGALTVVLIYWVTNRLSSQLDEQSRAIARLSESVHALSQLLGAKGGVEGK
ncbi:MAG: hypothetical protein LDL55_03705 [Armatimonadetes bacterium]|nr:hypothetical protein [Armatimonadota bacterium]